MNRLSLFGGLLLLLSLLAVPVSAVTFPGCPASGPTVNCRITGTLTIDPGLNNDVFLFNSFTLTPGANLYVSQVSSLPENNGGNITIIAKQIEIGGNIYANGGPGAVGWTLHGGNGGQIALIAKNRLFLGSDSEIAAKGAGGRVENCTGGNGGNGGKLNFFTISGASVSMQGVLNVSGGFGGVVPQSCANVTSAVNGTNGGQGTTASGLIDILMADFSLTVPDLTLQGGQNVTLALNAVDQFGDPIAVASSTWNPSNATVVTVSQLNATHAVVTGMRTGSAIVTVSSGGIQKNVTFTVSPGAFSRIEMASASNTSSLYYGESATFQLRGLDAGGNTVPIPAASRPAISISVVDSSTTVGGTAFSCLMLPSCPLSTPPYPVTFTAGNEPGTAVVRINYSGQVIDTNFTVVMPESAVVRVKVTPENPTVTSGASTTFSLIGLDADDDQSIFQADEWSVANLTGSGYINVNGSFTAQLPGIVTITASLNGLSNSTNATVVVGQANRINVSGPGSVVAGNAVTFTAVLTDNAGNLLTTYNGQAPAFTWSAPSGTIYPNGTFIPTEAGNITITASLAQNPAIQGTAAIIVTPGPVYALVVAESGSTINAGSTYLLNAVLVDKFGNEIGSTDASWSILNATGQATLNGRLITPTRIGYVNVNAVSLLNSSLAATGVLTIAPGQPASLQIQPSAPVIRQGDSAVLTVNAFDAFGNKFVLQSPTWSVSDSSVASISSSGVLQGLAPGTVSVTATAPTSSTVSASVTATILARLTSGGQVASQFSGSLPNVVMGADQPRTSISTSTGGSGGLTGLFTLGGGQGNLEVLLLASLALLLVGLVAYFTSTRQLA